MRPGGNSAEQDQDEDNDQNGRQGHVSPSLDVAMAQQCARSAACSQAGQVSKAERKCVPPGYQAGRRGCVSYSAAFGKAMAGSSGGVGRAGSSTFLRRRNRRLNQPRRSPFLRTSRVNTISIDGVTISVSTVAKERPNTIAEDSAIHHCVDGALMVV